ncbi:hypothetical protein Q3G72_012251 [Acer saccharum]|nr:hypothetical protein Q3G72_012251 [Acer saccharum]
MIDNSVTLNSKTKPGSSSSSISERGIRGPMDRFVRNVEEDHSKDVGGNKNEKEARDKTCMDIDRFFFENGIAFNVASSPSFINMCQSIGNYDLGLKPPTAHELSTTILKAEEDNTKEISTLISSSTLLSPFRSLIQASLLIFQVPRDQESRPKGRLLHQELKNFKFLFIIQVNNIGIGVGDDDDDDDLAMICNQKQPMSSLGMSGSGSGSGSGSRSNNKISFKKSKQKGQLDLYYNKTPLRQTKLGERETEAVKKELRDRVCKTFVRWMYDAGIPFNSMKYPSFKPFCEAVGQYGPGVTPPSYHEIRVLLLKKEVELTCEAMKLSGGILMALLHRLCKNLLSRFLASLAVHLGVNGIGAYLKINEWLTGRFDDDNARDDKLVFTAEDNLIWNDVATAAGVGESSYRFRSREASSSRPRAPQPFQVRPSNRLLDEEESEEEIEGEDGGDQLQQDEEIGGDDDYEFDFDA